MASTRDIEPGAWNTKDGAGGLDVFWADDIARKEDANWGRFQWNCGPFEERIIDQFALQGGRRFRASVAWSVDPAFPANARYELEPGSDIDLYITDISGQTITRSTTWDNSHEIVEFTPSHPTTVQLRLKRVRCTVAPGTVGWAWFQE